MLLSPFESVSMQWKGYLWLESTRLWWADEREDWPPTSASEVTKGSDVAESAPGQVVQAEVRRGPASFDPEDLNLQDPVSRPLATLEAKSERAFRFRIVLLERSSREIDHTTPVQRSFRGF